MSLLLLFLLADPARVAVKAARLLDVRTATVVARPVVLIEGDRITGSGPGLPIPPGAQVIDLGDMTILPGLIDCHTHLSFQAGNYYEDIFRRSPIDNAVVAHLYARRTLEAGFTTVRDVGGASFWTSPCVRPLTPARSPGRGFRPPDSPSAPPAAMPISRGSRLT